MRAAAATMPKLCSFTQKAESISTPARARRIIAEVAKKVLKDYYRKSCENIALRRKRNAAALILQCWFRSIQSKRIVHIRRKKKIHSLVRKVQTRIRIYLAKEKLQDLRWKREQVVKKQSAVQIQFNFRAFLGRKILKNLHAEKQHIILKNRETSIIRIQSCNRGFIVRKRRIKLSSSALKIQMKVRTNLAIKLVKYMKAVKWASILLFLHLMRWWKRRNMQRYKAARIIQTLVRWRKRKRYLASVKLQHYVKDYITRKNRSRIKTKKKEMRHTITIIEPCIPKIVHIPSIIKKSRTFSAPYLRERYFALAPIPDDWIIVTLDLNKLAVSIQRRVKLWFVNRNTSATIIQIHVRLWFIKREMSAIIIQRRIRMFICMCQKKSFDQKCVQAAETIQRSYRRYYVRQLDAAVLPIQRVRRRSILIRSWKATVFAVLARAHLAAEVIQCFVRTVHAVQRATNRRCLICEELSRQIEDGLQKSFSDQCWNSVNFKGSAELKNMICPEDYDDFALEFGWDCDDEKKLIDNNNDNNHINLDDNDYNYRHSCNERSSNYSYEKGSYDNKYSGGNVCTEKDDDKSDTDTDTDEGRQMRQTDWAAGLFEILGIGGSDGSMPPGCQLPQRLSPQI